MLRGGGELKEEGVYKATTQINFPQKSILKSIFIKGLLLNRCMPKQPKLPLSRFEAKRALGMAKSGYWIKQQYSPLSLSIVNCRVCSFRGTPICPHLDEVGKNGMHANGYCKIWLDVVKELYVVTNTKPRLLQVTEGIKSEIMLDKMYKKWTETGHLHDKYDKIQRNLITLIDKMRRQDEGIKVQSEVNITMEDFRKTVDAQAELVKDKDIVKEAELVEKKKEDVQDKEV